MDDFFQGFIPRQGCMIFLQSVSRASPIVPVNISANGRTSQVLEQQTNSFHTLTNLPIFQTRIILLGDE